MQVLRPVMQLIDIGPLQGALRLPTAGRQTAGMKTVCSHCGEDITDAFFIVGFKTGVPNMLLHEHCASDQVIMLIARGKSDHTEWAKDLLADRLMTT